MNTSPIHIRIATQLCQVQYGIIYPCTGSPHTASISITTTGMLLGTPLRDLTSSQLVELCISIYFKSNFMVQPVVTWVKQYTFDELVDWIVETSGIEDIDTSVSTTPPTNRHNETNLDQLEW